MFDCERSAFRCLGKMMLIPLMWVDFCCDLENYIRCPYFRLAHSLTPPYLSSSASSSSELLGCTFCLLSLGFLGVVHAVSRTILPPTGPFGWMWSAWFSWQPCFANGNGNAVLGGLYLVACLSHCSSCYLSSGGTFTPWAVVVAELMARVPKSEWFFCGTWLDSPWVAV